MMLRVVLSKIGELLQVSKINILRLNQDIDMGCSSGFVAFHQDNPIKTGILLEKL